MDELGTHIKVWELSNSMAQQALAHRWTVTTTYCGLVVVIAYYIAQLGPGPYRFVPLVFTLTSLAALARYVHWQRSYGHVVAGWMERARASERLIGERMQSVRELLNKDGDRVQGAAEPSRRGQVLVATAITLAVCVWVWIG